MFAVPNHEIVLTAHVAQLTALRCFIELHGDLLLLNQRTIQEAQSSSSRLVIRRVIELVVQTAIEVVIGIEMDTVTEQ